jgi:DNA repair exonuclease SbcCD ATPase subunit
LIVKKITLNNYKNFEGTHVFDFENYNLISGENGSGKSTLGLDSILFCLYGHSRQKLETLLLKKMV